MPTIFVIGAGPKIGLQVTRLFASNGFTSIGLASRSKANLEALATKLPPGTDVALADGTEAGSMESLVWGLDTLQQSLGKLDVIVYNASSLSVLHKVLKEMTVDEFEVHLQVTLVGTFVTSRWAEKHVNKSGHRPLVVLFTGGGLGHQPCQNYAGLAAGKVGLINLTKAFQGEHPDVHWAVVTVTGMVDKGDRYYSSEKNSRGLLGSVCAGKA